MEQTSSAVEEISATVSHNSDNAKLTDTMARKFNQDAKGTSIAVRDMVTALQEIASKVVLIDGLPTKPICWP